MGWFEHSGSRIYYEEHGSGDPVLLLPGFTGSIDELAPMREALAARYRVIAADLPGSGRSQPQPREYTATYYEDDARSFAALLAHLAGRPAHLMGFSDGGEVALLMAAVRPEMARSVIAWGAAGAIVETQSGLLDAFYNVVDQPIEPLAALSQHLKATYGEANARAMTQSFTTAAKAIIQAGGDISRSRAAGIACPVLLLAGAGDFFAPPALVSQLAEGIRCAEFEIVEGAGHAVHEDRPEWLAQTILDWLGKR